MMGNDSIKSTKRTLLDISEIQKVSTKYYFGFPTFKNVSPILYTICDITDPFNSHCRKLREHLFCAVNQEKYKNSPFLYDYCHGNNSVIIPNWSTNYHIKELMEEQQFYYGPEFGSASDILNEQINFVKKVEEITQNK
jgi:hypothetical protein